MPDHGTGTLLSIREDPELRATEETLPSALERGVRRIGYRDFDEERRRARTPALLR